MQVGTTQSVRGVNAKEMFRSLAVPHSFTIKLGKTLPSNLSIRPAEAREEKKGKLCNIMLSMQPMPAHELKSDDRDELKAALTEGSAPGNGNPILLTTPHSLPK